MYIASICVPEETIRIIEFNENGFNFSKELFISYQSILHSDKEIKKYFSNIDKPYIITNNLNMLDKLMPIQYIGRITK